MRNRDKIDPSDIIDEIKARKDWENRFYKLKAKKAKKYIYTPEEAKALNRMNL